MNSRHGNREGDPIDQRRASMRRDLLDHMQTHHRRRRARRRQLSAATLLLSAGLLLLFAAPLLRSNSTEVADLTNPTPHTDTPTIPAEYQVPAAFIQIVTTETSITDRYVRKPPSIIELIDDHSLLEDLVALNRPTGLIRSGDRVWFTAPVTDPLEQ